MLALGLIAAADAADCAVGGRGIVDALLSSATVATDLIPTFSADHVAGAMGVFADLGRPLPPYGCPPDQQEALRAFVTGLSTAASADLGPYVVAVFFAQPGDPALAEATAAVARWRRDLDALVAAVDPVFPALPDAAPFVVDPLPALSAEASDLPVSARYAIETRWVAAALEPWEHAKGTGEALFAADAPSAPAGAGATIAAECARIEALPPLGGATDARDRLAAGCRAWEALARAREATTKRGKIRKLTRSAAARASADAADRAPVDAITARWSGASEALQAWRLTVQAQGREWMQRRIADDHLMDPASP